MELITNPQTPVSPAVADKKKKIMEYALGGAVIIVVIGYFVFSYIRSATEQERQETAGKQLEDVSAALENATIETPVSPPSANPVKNLAPTVNPIKKTNPFDYEYENPFR